MLTFSILGRLDARDRALFARWALTTSTRAATLRLWTLVTHLGGVWCSIALATVPLVLEGSVHRGARAALPILVLSHLLVQLVKRTIGRARPSRSVGCDALVNEPDRFSFPSGHAAAAMSVALGYALVFPALAP